MTGVLEEVMQEDDTPEKDLLDEITDSELDTIYDEAEA